MGRIIKFYNLNIRLQNIVKIPDFVEWIFITTTCTLCVV